ncbi:GntR family transcriptional regulator [Limosilactobacillus sp.]|uniref:GntR family transcriptional regulator n=1 Tax=Limosilactobacillus sp. TaxID=2773925 RepID=UPI003F04AD8B
MDLQRSNNSLRAQIVLAIQNDIFNNRKVGDKLPSEAEYANEFDVTRSTIQKALKDLQRMNLIERVQGKGSFVHQRQPKVKLFNFKGFSDYAQQIGAKPVSKILEKKIITDNSNKILYLKRLRMFDSDDSLIPITVDESQVSLNRFHGLEKYDFSKESLYSIIRQEYKTIPSTTLLRMSAVSADKELAENLQCNIHDPLLQAQGVVHDEEGKIVEKAKVTYSNFAEFDLTLGI